MFAEMNCPASNSSGVNPVTCGGLDTLPAPSVDPRCEDPAFREANPDICAGYPILIIKPEYALTPTGQTVLYKTYLRSGGDEVELTTGLTYSAFDPGIATIHVTSGLATGGSPGITTIAVQWQEKHAHAQIEVVESCAEVSNLFLILIDNSQSSKVAFNGAFASRIAYAKEAARRFAELVNYSKDKVGVASFNASGAINLAVSSVKADVLAAITSVVPTDFKTNIHAGLTVAMAHLDPLDGHKAIILFSDGENNQGDDPVSLANAWKSQNKTIVVVALRAWGEYFDLLYQIATAGFFLSSYDATAADNIDTLVGLKSFLCGGDCQPEPGTYPMAKLNYRNFIHWDVFQGEVDLIGLGLWDVQPGNGLYVDLAGSVGVDGVPSGAQAPGGIESKLTFPVVSGEDYRFQIDVGGNNREDNIEPVRVQIYNVDTAEVYLDQTITPTAFDQPLTQQTFNFTPGTSGNVRIKIEMLGALGTINVGPIIDDVIFTNITTATVLLTDNFDNENETEIPFSYFYYGLCLESAPGAQAADPTPPTPPAETP